MLDVRYKTLVTDYRLPITDHLITDHCILLWGGVLLMHKIKVLLFASN